ncbi:hypothetical protein [Pleurocapsa sp. PCC 7319]|uniref:hypothetical protein n=1 Tax=Pleurocapsa sp. PCC 7319 TaxID=118161 RepID=UPI00034A1AC4|nr:hypothetical protein [Pleurocapsa sp. PCC 7319]
MKKLFCLSFALLAFGFQGAVSAQDSPDELVNSFCQEVEDQNITDESEMAEMVRSYIAELEEPTMEQIIALSQIAEKVENGQSINSICN